MPEYLAPAVYVEEVDTGSKPIEGVSTSTAGMLGVTERGPINTPILITSSGEYRRWFGDLLEIGEYSNGPDHPHCFLPYAVDGFFTNGGKRVYVTRIESAGATHSAVDLYDRGAVGAVATTLLRSADGGTGTMVNGPSILLTEPGLLGINDTIRIGDGSRSEYRQIVSLPTPSLQVPLQFSLSHAHAQGAAIESFVRAPSALALQLNAATLAGASIVRLVGATLPDASSLVVGQFLEFGTGSPEYRFLAKVGAVDPTTFTVDVTLDAPLANPYAAGISVANFNALAAPAPGAPTLLTQSMGGDALVFATSIPATFVAGALVQIVGAQTEIRSIGNLKTLTLQQGAYDVYPAGTRVDRYAAAPQQFSATAIVGSLVTLNTTVGLLPGQMLVLDPGGVAAVHVIQSVPSATTVTLTSAPAAVPLPAVVQVQRQITAAVAAGSLTLALGNRVGLATGDVLLLGAPGTQEYVTVSRALGSQGLPPDGGTVVLDAPTQLAHQSGDALVLVALTAASAIPAFTVLPQAVGDTQLYVANDPGFAVGDVVRVELSTGQTFFHTITSVGSFAPREVILDAALDRNHEAGAPVAPRNAEISVTALDSGRWGNRLRVSIDDQRTGLVSGAVLTGTFGASQIVLSSPTGVEPGTVLEMLAAGPSGARIGPLMKVVSVDRNNGRITLDAPLDAAQLAAVPTTPQIRSIEFQLTVRLMRRADALVPSRDDTVVQIEEFRNLSMDPRHSRYFRAVIGDVNAAPRLSDGRPEGNSWYVRVDDLGAAPMSIRSGPEALVDVLPNGTRRAARHAMISGTDNLTMLSDADYVGVDDVNPSKRTGLFALQNVDDISIVAVPGQTGVGIQSELIAHCERMRYRFAVLDGPEPPHDMIADVRAQRQQFDTRYAALYHPWLNIPQPFPSQVAPPIFNIPPSGQIIGVYARTDIERGVHKAPANEVVRGITGVAQTLSQSEQDILNPYPVNINVIRDFRKSNRGIRVWGARVITSDSDWKYVNVRRLMIFLEASIDRGLQWVVFEPNAEQLWARVRRTISNFLRVVWRNGALEGAKVEEAFFVRCDRSTMTQAEIDNGQLIVLIGIAPVKPAEFVIIRIGLWTAHTDD
ncbi:MAG: phage tail sheath C-terminal domain-containing protein [Gemmatimonas sp.]